MATRRSKFFSPRTAHFYSRLTHEYVNAMGQNILYYRVDMNKSDESSDYSIYRETVTKRYYPPVEVPCSVAIADKQTENLEDVGHELRTSVDAWIHREVLKTLDFIPEIGDIFVYQSTYFEVFDTNDAPELHGNPEYRYSFEINGIDIRIQDHDLQIIDDIGYKEETEN